ncbi:hypothetical protein SLE2022_058230 [Rubroshorea leprosula]
MASKAITGLRSEGAEPKRPVGNVAIDGIATRGWQANAPGTTTASARGTYLKTPQLSSAFIHHSKHLLLQKRHQLL